jgi:hypothetical protein
MTKAISNVATSTDNFQAWIDKTNQLLEALSNEVVTVSTSTYGNTTGNGIVNGIFGAVNLFASSSLRGGNVTTSNTLNITSNVNIANTATITGDVSLGGNVSITGVVTSVLSVSNTITVNTSVVVAASANNSLGSNVTAAQTFFSFNKTTYSSAKVLLQAKNTGNVMIQEGIVAHDGTDAYMTVFGTIVSPSGANLGLMSANVSANGSHIDLKLLQNTASTAVKVRVELLKA